MNANFVSVTEKLDPLTNQHFRISNVHIAIASGHNYMMHYSARAVFIGRMAVGRMLVTTMEIVTGNVNPVERRRGTNTTGVMKKERESET